MHPDSCETTTIKPDDSGDRWAVIESQAKVELDAAQVRYNAVKLLRRVYETHGHPTSILRAAGEVIEQYPALGADGGYLT